MGETVTTPVQPIWPWMQDPMGDLLFSAFYKKPTNAEGYSGWGISGLTPYPGQLNPDIGQTRLPDVWNNWQPWDAGTQFLANYLTNGWMADQNVGNKFNNIFQYGGPGGRATDLMNNMSQWGGTGGPGNNAMSLLMQYGAPSEAGRPIANMAQYGVSGSWGNPLVARAMGQPNASQNYLQQFLTAPAYKSPTLSAPVAKRGTGR